jgi:hypothetical protein
MIEVICELSLILGELAQRREKADSGDLSGLPPNM